MSDRKQTRNLILWGAGTTRTIRPHWVLQELNLKYEKRLVGSRTGETQTAQFRKLNPRGKIPVLQDGGLVLAESAAIINYLAENYGPRAGLVPSPGTPERGLYDQWCFFIMTELDAHTLYILRRHDDLHYLYGRSPNAVQAAKEGFARQICAVTEELRTGGPYLLGTMFTCADVLLTTCLTWARYCKIPLAPELSDYVAELTGRPAYRRAAEVNGGPVGLT